MGSREEKNLLVYLKPLFNVAYSWLADFLEEMQHNNRIISPQPLDHFPTMIGSPHNHWIISQQWLNHLTTIGSFSHNDWITSQPMDHFLTMSGSPQNQWTLSPQHWSDQDLRPFPHSTKQSYNKKKKGRWANLGH